MCAVNIGCVVVSIVRFEIHSDVLCACTLCLVCVLCRQEVCRGGLNYIEVRTGHVWAVGVVCGRRFAVPQECCGGLSRYELFTGSQPLLTKMPKSPSS